MAKLYFRYAVMNAGKSTQLLQIAYDYEKYNHRKVLCLKPGADTKEGQYIISRLENGEIKRKCDFLILPDKDWIYQKFSSEIKKANEKGKPVSIVLIDEAQFLSRHNVWDLARVVTDFDVPVICFGIKVDAFGNPFEGSQVAIENDDDVRYLPVSLDVYLKLKFGKMELPPDI
jgi:thymidine kinase